MADQHGQSLPASVGNRPALPQPGSPLSRGPRVTGPPDRTIARGGDLTGWSLADHSGTFHLPRGVAGMVVLVQAIAKPRPLTQRRVPRGILEAFPRNAGPGGRRWCQLRWSHEGLCRAVRRAGRSRDSLHFTSAGQTAWSTIWLTGKVPRAFSGLGRRCFCASVTRARFWFQDESLAL